MDALQRFEEKFIPVTESGCWIWTAAVTQRGYGRFGFKYKAVRAHRFSYEIYVGEIPEGMNVCHSCDIPECVNPNHLFLGTHTDNMVDMMHKGRQNFSFKNGEQHVNSKLTWDEVRAIRASKNTQMEIAKEYNVSLSAINAIKTNKTWRE